ncbi:MAG: superoxide dismutase family protein [Flavobacteriaceae bacterium]|nr:superoxide dismutase family protein [Flavobacteriaceae bacterium]
MNIKFLAIYMFLFVAFISCKNNKNDNNETQEEIVKETVEENVEVKEIIIMMEPRSNSNTKGKVTFTEKEGVVSMHGEFEGLTPGMHAIHLHEKADCSAPDGTSTGGHWNPTFERHGKWGDAEGYHKGDIGNFEADENGNGMIHFETDQWCIGCDDETKNILGKSVIVHQGVDDFVTQPTGDAGGRISCGGIIK